MKIEHILAAVDFSPASGHALRGATQVASRSGAKLTVLHAHGRRDEAETRALLAGFVQTWRARDCGEFELEKVVVRSRAAYATLAFAAKEAVDLIVCGSRGRTGLKRLLLGSVAEKLVRMSGCPVWVFREPPREMHLQKVLLACDLREIPEEISAAAERITRLFEAQLTGMYVVQRSDFHGDKSEYLDAWYLETETEARKDLAKALPDAQALVDVGEPAERILARAAEKGVDLIVCGSHQRRGLDHWILGSVSEKLVRQAQCSVLCVPLVPLLPGEDAHWWSSREGLEKDWQEEFGEPEAPEAPEEPPDSQ